jgi:hypothetical protein
MRKNSLFLSLKKFTLKSLTITMNWFLDESKERLWIGEFCHMN